MSTDREMPRYRSHKIVHALEIKTIGPDANGNIVMVPVESGFAPLTFEPEAGILVRYKPKAGDFLIVYADGYKSFSPRKSFLEGYSPDSGDQSVKVTELVIDDSVTRLIRNSFC